MRNSVTLNTKIIELRTKGDHLLIRDDLVTHNFA